MKLAAVLLPMSLVLPLLAQQNPEFAAGMKVAAAANGVLSKAESKTTPEAVRAAERIGGVYEQMIGFWRQRDAADAVKLSLDGKAAAVALASAAHAGDAEKAAEAYKTLGTTCKPCHEKYREKLADGSYRIKIPEAK